MAGMTAAFPGQITAVQVGATFAGQYYQFLEQQPGVVHRFYTDVSTVMRMQGATGDTAVGVMQIHSLVMSLGVCGIEIKSVNSLDSWAGGVLVTVFGSVQTKDFNAHRKFVQTFFLAPQEKGYFVLNDIFQFVDDDEHTLQQPQAISQNHFNSTGPIAEPVSDHMPRGEGQVRNFEAPVHAEENGAVDKYSIPEPPKQITECNNRVEDTLLEEPVVSTPCITNTMRDLTPASTEESVGGPPKQTYASILRVAKGQLGHSATQSVSLSKTGSVASEWHHTSHSRNQHSHPVVPLGSEKPSMEAVESFTGLEDEGDPRSIYVGNLPSSISATELEQEFKSFGRISHNGVTIRNRKDSSVNYAFVDFEDVSSAQNALKASPILINGYKIYIEERKSSNSTSRMGRKSRGRGDYLEGPMRRMSARGFARGNGDENDKEFSLRLRGNGFFHSRSPHQERGLLGNHNSRRGQSPSRPAS